MYVCRACKADLSGIWTELGECACVGVVADTDYWTEEGTSGVRVFLRGALSAWVVDC